MGLDIVLYDNDNKILGVTEIDYALHEGLFQENNNWKSFLFLRKLSDYYLTDITFDRKEIDNLISDLDYISLFISKQKLKMLEKLISCLSDENIKKIHIAGD
ncbi:hypothetical protein FLK61_37485 [Paenalkalicoccus suaedae]|uniref:Uncharacterized protein n=1 Tax=Paenalkalicoccus suaedae TaxID=2592382 RepID=A0A859FGS1_9BACI|nr:hypothetical protein [Paenalkalicoccus suaedae]QKS72329.1 hypothetical protein FLK61_37485 [Paenalkalicoccus suaedae]